MYYLINNEDNSFNCKSDAPFPDALKTPNVTEVFWEGAVECDDPTFITYDYTSLTFIRTADVEIEITSEEELEDVAQAEEEQYVLDSNSNLNTRLNTLMEQIASVLTSEQAEQLRSLGLVGHEASLDIDEVLNATSPSS
jgi:hypothetical protein